MGRFWIVAVTAGSAFALGGCGDRSAERETTVVKANGSEVRIEGGGVNVEANGARVSIDRDGINVNLSGEGVQATVGDGEVSVTTNQR